MFGLTELHSPVLCYLAPMVLPCASTYADLSGSNNTQIMHMLICPNSLRWALSAPAQKEKNRWSRSRMLTSRYPAMRWAISWFHCCIASDSGLFVVQKVDIGERSYDFILMGATGFTGIMKIHFKLIPIRDFQADLLQNTLLLPMVLRNTTGLFAEGANLTSHKKINHRHGCKIAKQIGDAQEDSCGS